MARHSKQRSRQAKRPLSEIEIATEVIRQRGLTATNELFAIIMTIGNLSDDQRQLLLTAANRAIGETITSLGHQGMLIREKYKRKTADAARAGNSIKATRWHDEARTLAVRLWNEKPHFRGNASSTAQTIHGELTDFCRTINVGEPKPGTVAKYLSCMKEGAE